ncbi:unnamed protein product [Diatraea saccharalis]|uniref:CLIP domain-containing serine protease n=1 Tax=Diatraea saccharalis TaxID=40085 RepID=A0A9N9WE37_9NEOP|nr:unnamed protein product [Diatraea saccharalis]
MDRFSLCTLLALLLPVKCLYAGDSCIADDQPGTCSRLSECKPLMDEIRRAGNPMPIHLRMKLIDLSCGFESEEPVVCCTASSGNPSVVTPDPVATAATSVTMDVTSDSSVSKQPNDDGDANAESRLGLPNVQNHPNLRLLPTTNCGIYDSDRVFGGNRTRLYEMPWMVLLAYDSPRGRKLSCGGTLISEWYVLTAAHCVSFLGERLKFKGVVLGEYDVRKDPDCERIEEQQFCAPSVRNVSVETVVAHKGYSPQTLVDDIALLRLSEPADFNLESMSPVCLPFTSKLQTEDLVGRSGIVAGWGATEDGLQSPVLLSVDLPIVGNKECQDAYNGNPRIYDRQLCAGGIQDKDSCGGDSGGPLMYPGSVGLKGARYVQRGIVSYGSKRCGLGGLPGVYTRLAYYMDWILDNMHD